MDQIKPHQTVDRCYNLRCHWKADWHFPLPRYFALVISINAKSQRTGCFCWITDSCSAWTWNADELQAFFQLSSLFSSSLCVFGESAQSCPLAAPQGSPVSIPLSAWRQWPDHFFEGLCFSHVLGRWTPRHGLQNTTGAGKGGSFNLEQPRTSSVDWSSFQNLQVCKETPLFPSVWG